MITARDSAVFAALLIRFLPSRFKVGEYGSAPKIPESLPALSHRPAKDRRVQKTELLDGHILNYISFIITAEPEEPVVLY